MNIKNQQKSLSPRSISGNNKEIKNMLEKLITDYNNWLKIGENMSKKPVSYFENSGQYAGYLRTKAWYEIQIANYMEMENAENVFPVEVKEVKYN